MHPMLQIRRDLIELKAPYYEKHVFSGAYINWSSLSLPTPRMKRKQIEKAHG